jgi:glucokinase
MRPTAGIDLGGTKVQAVVLDGDGEVAGQGRTQTPTEGGPPEVVAAIAAALAEAAAAAGSGPGDLDGLGVGSPGQIDQAAATVAGAANLPGFEDPVALAELVAEATGVGHVLLDNDVNAGTLAEHRHGAGRGHAELLAVFAGSGVGGALVLGGELRRGWRGAAGEIGHTVVVLGGERCSCGRLGCMEAYAGRVSFERRAREAAEAGRATALFDLMRQRGRERMTSGVIAAALDAGDELAVALLDQAIAALAAAIASAVNLVDVGLVVLGGGLAEKLGDPFTERVAEAMAPHLFAQPPRVKVTGATLGDLGGAIGAAELPHDKGHAGHRKHHMR